MTNGKFQLANFDELCVTLVNEPFMTYAESAAEIGLENMPTMYDIANIKKYFYDLKRSDILEEPGIIFEKVPSLNYKQRTINAGSFKLSFYSHLDNPDLRYLWTNEFIGYAPEGHPAQGQLILARIDSVDINSVHENIIFGSQQGKIKISDSKYAVLNKLKHVKRHGAWEGHITCGYILDFEEKNGLLVPITDGSDYLVTPYDKNKDINGYGTLDLTLKELVPLSCRPVSWKQGLVFNNNSPVNCRFKVLRKCSLDRLIQD